MKHRSLAVLSALVMLAALIPTTALATEHGTDPVVVASDLVDTPANLVAYENPLAGEFSSPGDGFEIYQRGVSPSIPFSLVDDSASSFPSDSLGIIGEDQTGRFFGATDTQNSDNTDPVTATWTFDVSSATGPLFLNIDAGAMGDFEANSDLFEFSVGPDSASLTTVLTATVDEDASRPYTMDGGATFTLADPIDLGGTPLDNDLTTVSVPIEADGETLAVAFTAQTNGGSEGFAFDSLVITQDAPLADEPAEPAEPVCDATDITLISEVQGTGDSSPLAGDSVTVRAVVTLIAPELGGYFVQEESPDDVDTNPATSEGLFIAGTVPVGAVAGSTVEATGDVAEAFGRTQINEDEVAVCDEVGPITIDSTPLTLPADTAERETLEGMVVETTQDLFVSSLFTAYQFGELGVVLDGPLTQPTSAFAPDAPQAQQLADDNAESLLFINDRDEFGSDNAPWFHDVRRRAGDVVEAGAVGALNFSFGDFLLEPLGEFPEIVQLEERPAAPALAEGNDIGAFNVLNYFNTFGDSDVLRGATSQEQFDLQSAKIVQAILELDTAILGLIELENDYEDHYDGDSSTVPSIQTLVEQLNAKAGAGTYDWIVPPEPILTDEGLGGGGLGTDAIAQGIIYQPARVTPVGQAATFDIDALLEGPDTEKNRWPLAQSFQIDGQIVTVVVNHFKSKGSSCEDVDGPTFDPGDDGFNVLTGNCNLTREYAAHRLVDWAGDRPTGVGTDKTFLVGDFNSYEEEGPIEILVDAGYVDLVQNLGDDAFTFKFDGRYGRLDYAFASSAASDIVEDAMVWQANSPEPYGYLYFNDPVETPGAATAYASSDHDPVVLSTEPRSRSGGKGDRGGR